MHAWKVNKAAGYLVDANILSELSRCQVNARSGAHPARLPKTSGSASGESKKTGLLTGGEECVIVKGEGERKAMHTWKGNKAAVRSRQEAHLKQRELSLVDVMRSSPLFGVELNIERDRSPARDIKL